MFISRVEADELEERLDPAYYAPLALQTDHWLAAVHQDNLDRLGYLTEVVASAFYEGLSARYGERGVAFVRVGDVRLGTVELSRTMRLDESIATGTPGLAYEETPLLVLTKGGSVGRVGLAFEEVGVALSRDVLGLVARDERQLPRILFYLASPPGRAQVLRGASRQVQAHLTVERLRAVRVPRLAEADQQLLTTAYDKLKFARMAFEAADDAATANFVAAYLTTQGAHNQAMRAGSGVRFRSYSREQLSDLLLPPPALQVEFATHLRAVASTSEALHQSWANGIQLMLNAIGWGTAADVDLPDDAGVIGDGSDGPEELD